MVEQSGRYVGNPEWNMAALSLARMDTIIRALIVARLRYDGDLEVASILRRWYCEISSYLNPTEKDTGEGFLKVIEQDYPIIQKGGGSYEIEWKCEVAMNNFELWLYKKLKDKGILQKFTEDPSEAIY